MKITNVKLQVSFIIETDNEEFGIYRRNNSDSWENLMGASWEQVWSDWRIQELEELFQEWPKTKNYD